MCNGNCQCSKPSNTIPKGEEIIQIPPELLRERNRILNGKLAVRAGSIVENIDPASRYYGAKGVVFRLDADGDCGLFTIGYGFLLEFRAREVKVILY